MIDIIYLQLHGPDDEEATWCKERIRHNDVEYIRKDLYDDLKNQNYPESLVERCAYLERVISGLKDVIENNDNYIHNLRVDLKKLRDFMDKNPDSLGTWVYQGDGYDFIRSMSNDLPVLITAHELRNLIENGEKGSGEQGVSAPMVSKHVSEIETLKNQIKAYQLTIANMEAGVNHER